MKMENLKFLFIILTAVFGVLAAVSGFMINYFDKKIKVDETNKSAIVGTLKTPDVIPQRDYFTILLGQETMVYSIETLRTNDTLNPILNVFGIDFPFQILVKDKPLISTTLRSIDNKVIAVLDNNEWRINPNNYFDRNYDNSTLEIVDQYNIPVFRIELIDSLTIMVNGVFVNNRKILILTDSVSTLSIGDNSIEMIIEKCKDLRRIFRYPSTQHLGDRIFEGSEYAKSLRSRTEKAKKNLTDAELIEESEKIYEWVLRQSAQKHSSDPKTDLAEWQKILNEYFSTYRSKALYCRSELYKRSSIEPPKGLISVLYDNPTNPTGFEMVAKDLRYIIDEFRKNPE